MAPPTEREDREAASEAGQTMSRGRINRTVVQYLFVNFNPKVLMVNERCRPF